MAILFRKIKSLSGQKTLAVVLLAGFTALLLSTPFASANGPQFNIFPISYNGGLNRDLPLLDCRNVTRGDDWSDSQSQHDDGVASNPGDTVECSIYYHNGAVDADENTAHDTVIRASISPSFGSLAFSYTVSASVGASNASTAVSGNHGGDVRINIPNNENLSLSLIPGSTVLFRNQGSNPTTESLPDSVFFGGVNIGDVRGCFEFHGFVNFKLRVSDRVAFGDLRVQKHVKNITQGIPFRDDEVPASPGDTVEYQILVSSITNPVHEVRVRDSKDFRLQPFGQVTVDGSQVLDFSLFLSSGAMIGSVAPGETKDIRFQARVSQDLSNFPTNQDVRLENTAVAFNNEKSAQDRADVMVRREQQQLVSCAFTWSSPTASDGRGLRRVGQQANVREVVSGLQPFQSFAIVNRNFSSGQTFPSTVQANSLGSYDIFDTTIIPSSFPTGDYETFIQVNGQRSADCKSFRIETPAPQVACIFTWNDPTTADRRGIRQVGQAANVREQVSGLQPFQNFTIVNRHLGYGQRFPSTVQANSQGNYDFFDTTIIPASFPTGDYETFIEVSGQTVANCKSFRIEAPQIQQITIDKQVRNENTGIGFSDLVNAAPSQTVVFRIVVTPGPSNINLENVFVRDLFPSDKLTFVSGSLNVDGMPTSDLNFFGGGISLGTLSPNSSKTVIFSADVKSASNFDAGCIDRVNTATVTASGNLSASNDATVRICKETPQKQPGSPGQRPLD